MSRHDCNQHRHDVIEAKDGSRAMRCRVCRRVAEVPPCFALARLVWLALAGVLVLLAVSFAAVWAAWGPPVF